MMAGLDGYAALERLKENAATRGIPVIFATALDSTEDETRGLEPGVDYIASPSRSTPLPPAGKRWRCGSWLPGTPDWRRGSGPSRRER